MSLCNAPCKTNMGPCMRPGSPKFGGRCAQHRVISSEEAKVRVQEKRAARIAALAADEAQYELGRKRRELEKVTADFVSAALVRGLDHSGTRALLEIVREKTLLSLTETGTPR